MIHFSFLPKIIRILRSCSMKIFCKSPTANISKLNYWLLICIAKNLIWTTLNMIFSIFRFFCTLRFQIFKYCPNHTSMEILFIQLQMMHKSQFKEMHPNDWFCAPGSHFIQRQTRVFFWPHWQIFVLELNINLLYLDTFFSQKTRLNILSRFESEIIVSWFKNA